MKHLTVGIGEVGAAIHEIFGGDTYDMKQEAEPPTGHYDVLHLCFPDDGRGDAGNSPFSGFARAYQDRHAPGLVIIHSTVRVGTTRALGEIFVHSPVNGLHRLGMAESMRKFQKPVGGISPVHRCAAEWILGGHFYVTDYGPPEATELAKLLDTAYYGWNILFAKEAHRHCEAAGLDFSTVYQQWNAAYNIGYDEMGHVKRPVLQHMPGPIGGHCVIPNAHLLPSWLSEVLLDRNETYKAD